MLRRSLAGALIIGSIAAVSLLWTFGYVAPRPFANMSSSQGWMISAAAHSDVEPAVVVRRALFNNSWRDVRLTAVTIDAPGFEIASVAARIAPLPDPGACEVSEDGSMRTCTVDQADGFHPGEVPVDAQLLPITIAPRRDVDYYVRLRRTDCTTEPPSPASWSDVGLTFDFGESAFPPITRTEEQPGPGGSDAAGRPLFALADGGDWVDLMANLCPPG